MKPKVWTGIALVLVALVTLAILAWGLLPGFIGEKSDISSLQSPRKGTLTLGESQTTYVQNNSTSTTAEKPVTQTPTTTPVVTTQQQTPTPKRTRAS